MGRLLKVNIRKMKRITLTFILLLLLIGKGWSVQDPLYSQFMTNPFLINPAIAGTYPYYQVYLNSRLQWVGMSDAPITNILSMNGPMVNQPMGLGGYILNDATGPESKTTLNVTYAYNYSIAEDLKISMGLMLGLIQHKIGELTMEEDDPIYSEGQIYKNIKPDGTLGFYLYSSTYHAGISMTNLFGSKLKFETNDTISFVSRLKQHFYLHGGYKYLINREMSVEPTMVLRKVSATPLQIDLNCRFWYANRQWDGNKLWGGLSYRSSDAVVIMIGFTYQRKIEIGYSYDVGINKLRKQNAGSHEIMIGFKFNDIKEY